MRPTIIGLALLASIGVAGPVTARAQSADLPGVTPAAAQMDGRRIPAFTRTWQSYRLDPGGARRPLAVWYDTVSVIERDGGEVLRRVQHIVPAHGPPTVLVNEADRTTLLPRWTSARVGDEDPFIDLRFEGHRVLGRRPLVPHNGGPGDQVPVSMTLELPGPVYDWRWWGLLAAALPLEADYATRFLAFATESNVGSPLILITVRVVGEASVGHVRCWVVELEAGAPWTVWIAREGSVAPVQRIRIEQPDGSALLWESIDR